MSQRGFSLPATAALALALMAPALGGGTSDTAVTFLVGGIGLVALIAPARGLRPGFLIWAGLVLIATLDWAWPARFNQLPWREMLEGAGFSLPGTTSAEPWVSLRAWLILLGGLVWAGWCMGQVWTNASRRAVCEGLAVGIGAIAAVAVAARNGHVPGWPAGTGLGPFANRNQTATLFAMGAFLTLACGAGRLRRMVGAGRVAVAIAWLCLLGIDTAALAMDRSRAGPLLFVGMTLVWALAAAPAWKRPVRTLALGLTVALVLATIFLLTGQSVLSRLAGSRVADFRLKIFSDALRMIGASPWTGTGLGTFDAIFPLYRNASILQERVIHPESDWLWLAAETGVAGVLAAAGLLAWMGAQAWRGLARAEERAMRWIACVACLGFLAHSFVDVAGHRLGTMMPALLLLGMAAGEEGAEKRRMGWILRTAGVAMLLAAIGLCGWKFPAPLDWRAYAERAQEEGARGEYTEALGDFRKARFLEPDYAGLPFDEGLYWLGIAPQLSIEPWREALRRMPWDRRAELYQQMLAHAYPANPELHDALAALGAGDARMELAFLGWATPGEFRARMDALLSADPDLKRFDAVQLRTLFPLWMSKGNPLALAALMPSHPDWLAAGYRTLATFDAANGKTAAALALMHRYLPAPAIPQPPAISRGEAARRFAEDPSDFAAGLALYDDAIAAGREEDALQILEGISGQSGCPGYVHYLEGQLLAKKGRTTEAWQALEQCAPE
jgi:O-antigen ligase